MEPIPGAREALALRAKQLAEPRHRARIARSIDRLLDLVERGATRILSFTRVPVQADRVEDNRPQLMELADRLKAVDSPPVKGVAMATLLVEDGLGAPLRPRASGPSPARR